MFVYNLKSLTAQEEKEKKKSNFNSNIQEASFPDTTYFSQYLIIFGDTTKGKTKMSCLWSVRHLWQYVEVHWQLLMR